MSAQIAPRPKDRSTAGIPPGMVDLVVSVLKESPGGTRRRTLLEELERRGHRISLAGLNRILQYCVESGRTTEGPAGIRAKD